MLRDIKSFFSWGGGGGKKLMILKDIIFVHKDKLAQMLYKSNVSQSIKIFPCVNK